MFTVAFFFLSIGSLTVCCGLPAATWNWTRWGSQGNSHLRPAPIPPLDAERQNLCRPWTRRKHTSTQSKWEIATETETFRRYVSSFVMGWPYAVWLTRAGPSVDCEHVWDQQRSYWRASWPGLWFQPFPSWCGRLWASLRRTESRQTCLHTRGWVSPNKHSKARSRVKFWKICF